MFQEMIAPTESTVFDVETALANQIGVKPNAFAGMDKSNALVCVFFQRGTCLRGALCPYRHVRGEKSAVCKHWLRSLCKKGDDCEYLHEYDVAKMPACFFFAQHGQCLSKDCPFLHVSAQDRIRDCPWYDRGFCYHGPNCQRRHRRRVMCPLYLYGFCPRGADCQFAHPRFELPVTTHHTGGFGQANAGGGHFQRNPGMGGVNMSHFTCHLCGETGHKAAHCLTSPPELKKLYSDTLKSLQERHLPPSVCFAEAQRVAVRAREQMKNAGMLIVADER